MIIPRSLDWLRRNEDGASWLDRLPSIVDRICAQWHLQPDWSRACGNVSYVVPAHRSSDPGIWFVLKVQWPGPECMFEADALQIWDGAGAVRLIDSDKASHSLLLEYCKPGTYLADSPNVDHMQILQSLLPRLWLPAGKPFRSLSEEASDWKDELHQTWEYSGRPCDKRLVDAAYRFLTDLPPSQGEQVLLHQDLHGHNILSARREPWLAIDPKPLVGEREFGLAPIVRSVEFGHSHALTLRRLDHLTSELGLDRRRAIGWTIGQTMAWSFSSPNARPLYQIVEWLLDEI